MIKSGPKRTAAIIICSAVVMIMIAVSWHSTSLTGDQSNEKSFKIVHLIGNTVGKFLSVDQNDLFWTETLNKIVRKTGHFLEYLIMGTFICTLLNITLSKKKHTLAITLLICLALSLLDEFRQIFITGRAARLSDVFIDMVGAALGILFAYLLFPWVLRIIDGK